VRRTRIFSVVLVLHLIAVGGILAFKMIDKASGDSATVAMSARQMPREARTSETAVAARAPAHPNADHDRDIPAVPRPPVDGPARVSRDGYQVKAGDTLAAIAAELNVSADALRRKNTIQSEGELYPGRWLAIPTAAEAAAMKKPTPTQQARPVATSAAQDRVHTIQPGETAWGIAQRYGVGHGALLQHNSITRPEALQIGQTLRIPAR